MDAFTQKHNIPTKLIRVLVINDKKTPIGAGKNDNFSKETLMTRAKQFKYNCINEPTDEYFAYCLQLKETTEPIYCFDVDENKPYEEVIETYPFLKNTIYTEGNSKGFHFYIKINNLPSYTNEVKVGCENMPEIDLIRYKKNMWEKETKIVYGNNMDCVEWYDIKKHFNMKAMSFQAERPVRQESNVEYPEIKNDELYKLIDCLDDSRAENTDTWRIIGACIYNEKKEHGLPFFIRFSHKSQNHYCADEELEHHYNNYCAKYNQYTIGTIRYFAKQDKPEIYNALFKKSGLECASWDAYEWSIHLREVLYSVLRFNNGDWFVCLENLWVKVPSPQIITTPEMKKVIKSVMPLVADIEDELRRKDVNKTLLQLLKKVDTAGFHKQLKEYLCVQFKDNDFENKLYSHVGKLVFRNGILDMADGDFVKQITPEDYVMRDYMIDWDYNPTFNLENCKFLKEKLLQIHNNSQQQLDYVLMCYAYALSGCREKNIFINIKGVRTGNGKSTITDTLQSICPSLISVMPQLVLQKDYQKRHKYLAGTIGKRIVCFEELPKDKELDNAFIKDITGGVNYSTELMYKETKDIRILWTPFANTNHTPKFESGVDMERRYREINCDCKFWPKQEYEKLQKSGKATDKDFEADDTIRQKFIEAKNEIIHILVAYYKRYLEKGLVEPDFITQWSKETIECNNDIGNWFDENTVITQATTDFLPKKQLEMMLKAHRISFKDAKDYLKSKGVEYDCHARSQEKNNKWKGAFVGITFLKEEEEV